MLTPAPAFAVIEDPPSSAYEIVIFPERDFVFAGWKSSGTALTFELRRGGVIIGGSASDQVIPSLTTGADNGLEVNHPGGLCWAGSTPDILPGDVLTILESGTDVGVSVMTQNVTANAAVQTATGIEVTGTAFNVNGTPMDLSLMEQRIINPDGFSNGRRDIRATTDPGSLGTLVATAPGHWKATYTLPDPDDVTLALAGQTRALAWMAADAAGNRLGITIYEVGEPGGPGMGGCPAAAENSVAGAAPAAVNAANIAGGLTLSGASFDATGVTITLNDTDPVTPAQTATDTPASATGASSYAVNFTGTQLAGLSDGVLTATSNFSRAAGPSIAGTGTTILKDTLVPLAPTTDTAPGTYVSAQSIRLSRAAGENATSVVHFTTDGSAPSATSPTLQPIAITSSRTVRGVVVDPAGNVSAPSAFAYTISGPLAPPAPPAPAAPAPAPAVPAAPLAPAAPLGPVAIAPLAPRIGLASSGARGGARTAVTRWAASNNGAVVDGYEVRALRLRSGRAAKALPAVVAGRSARRLKLSLPAGKYRFQVRATSAAGNSPWSAVSNKVVAR